jgi:hypothetical protein
MDYSQLITAQRRITRAAASDVKRMLKDNPNREYSEMDAQFMSKEFYDKVALIFKKEQAEKESMERYNKLIGRSKRRR